MPEKGGLLRLIQIVVGASMLAACADRAATSKSAMGPTANAARDTSTAPPSIDRLADDAGLADSADGRRLLSYAVQCALPASEQLVSSQHGETLKLQGALALAPGWKKQPLSPTDQRWLSACILARINAFGVTIPISLRGAHPALLGNLAVEEKRDFGFEEGAFYGNFFADPPAIYACAGKGGTPRAPTREKRVCTEAAGDDPASSRCGMVLTGECASVCRVHDDTQGSYSQCVGGGVAYAEVVTVLLKNGR